jgi:hypothetical protein
MQYVFMAYIYNLNAILVCIMPSKNYGAMIVAFTDILAILNAHGYAPMLNVIGNKCSKAIKAHIRNNHMDIHLVSLHNHQVNAAKRTIATFKEHFMSALTAVNRNFQLQLCDNFLTQVELTLENLLRLSRWIQQNQPMRKSTADLTRTKCTKGLVYNDLATRASWAPHGTNAYYVDPELQHF